MPVRKVVATPKAMGTTPHSLATGYVSAGMMVDTIYRDEDWIDDTLLS